MFWLHSVQVHCDKEGACSRVAALPYYIEDIKRRAEKHLHSDTIVTDHLQQTGMCLESEAWHTSWYLTWNFISNLKEASAHKSTVMCACLQVMGDGTP